MSKNKIKLSLWKKNYDFSIWGLDSLIGIGSKKDKKQISIYNDTISDYFLIIFIP